MNAHYYALIIYHILSTVRNKLLGCAPVLRSCRVRLMWRSVALLVCSRFKTVESETTREKSLHPTPTFLTKREDLPT